MKLKDMLGTAFMNLWRRKLRAILTVLGMVIGTSSIVVMVSLGIGIRSSIVESYASMGSLTNITVSSWRWVESPDGMGGTSTEKKLDKKSVETFKTIPGVVAVMPRIETWGSLKSGKWVSDCSILGIDKDVAAQFGIELSEGRYPAYKRGSSTYEIVMSQDVLNWFYDPNTGKQATNQDGTSKIDMDSRFQLTFDHRNIYQNMGNTVGEGEQPLGKMYRLDAVGMVSPNNNEFSWYCLMDLEALKKLAKENPDMNLDTSVYQQVLVKCADTKAVASVKAAIDEMFRQVGPVQYDENGLLKKGVLIRHLILPGQTDSAKDVIDYVAEHFEKGSVLFSLMAQYIPCGDAVRYPEINRRLTQEEYDEVAQYLMDSPIENGFFQELESAEEEYVPNFDLGGVLPPEER